MSSVAHLLTDGKVTIISQRANLKGSSDQDVDEFDFPDIQDSLDKEVKDFPIS